MGRLPAVCLAAAAICACSAQGADARPARCAAKTPRAIPMNSWAPAQAQLAPAGPTAVRLCRYSGLNDHPRLHLVRSLLRTDSALLTKLVRDDLPRSASGFGSPPAFGPQLVARLKRLTR